MRGRDDAGSINPVVAIRRRADGDGAFGTESHMSMRAPAVKTSCSAVLAFFFAAASLAAVAGQPLTVAEEIALAHFGDPYGGEAQALQFSPDGQYFAVLTERGRIDLNRPQDTLRIYRTHDVVSFLERPSNAQPPEPLWAVDRATDQDGPLITQWRWLGDSSGIAYLERGAHGAHRLMLADLKMRTIDPLTPEGEAVNAFDIRDRQHYVYAVPDLGLVHRAAAEGQAVAIVGTGRLLDDLLFPADQSPHKARYGRSELWAVVGGQPFQVKDRASGQALVLFMEGQADLALSPNGESVVTALAVEEIPPDWEQRYLPPFAASPYRLHAGKQDLTAFMGYDFVSRYVSVELRSGVARVLVDAPIGTAAGWWTAGAAPAWSQDGKAIVLPSTFVAPNPGGVARVCVAVVSSSSGSPSCVEQIDRPSESGSREHYDYVTGTRFAGGDGRRLLVTHDTGRADQGSTEYRLTATDTWTVAKRTVGANRAANGELEVSVRQGVNDPPTLMATDAKTRVSRAIWDPNPQLRDISLGEATVYRWKDKADRNWKGGLFKPVSYEAGRRYPLVIQTHGFTEAEFKPSGIFPTAFAARALAGAGLAVLQVQDCPISGTPEEGPCNVDGYESAVNELAKAGLVDPERIGLIGFSRTCFYVVEALTTSTLHVRAASITDGTMGDYLQYMLDVDASGFAEDTEAMIGARPFAQGLALWLKRSPLFNMDKVSAALQVVAEGRSDLPFMWGPYAAMRYLHKPVDLILLNNDQHVLSNPGARLVSQGGAVDWMRFWLQDYEDPDPTKADQYKRWRELRALQPAK
jgi:dipeptidyl aminopeptidase/acylaminoacyl peptidase